MKELDLRHHYCVCMTVHNYFSDLYAIWFEHVTPSGYFTCHQSLTIENSTLCPQSLLMYFVWI
jgi:hypothetical protein